MSTIRRPGAASAAVLVGLTVSLCAANLLAPEWARGAGLDVWNYPVLEARQRSLTEERAEMHARAESETRRRALADQLAGRLVTGDTPLAAVAAEVAELFAADTGWWTTLESLHPGLPDRRLLHARHAIDRAVRQLDRDPARQAAVRARLEGEYRALEVRYAAAR